MIQKYQKKPVTIEAIQFKEETIPTIKEWLGENLVLEPHLSSVHWAYYIVTLEGKMLVSLGDFIIKGVKGEFYPCKPDIFYATYDGPVKVLWDHTTGEYDSEYFKPNTVTIKEKEVEKISEDEARIREILNDPSSVFVGYSQEGYNLHIWINQGKKYYIEPELNRINRIEY